MTEKNPALSIVLPAYKEKDNLAVFIPRIEEEFKDVNIEIIVVDDNSKDGTKETLNDLDSRYQNVILIERPSLLGLGSALRDGYNAARGQYILSSDSDLSFLPKDMRSLYQKIQTGFDLVLGYRVNQSPAGGQEVHKKTIIGRFEMFIASPLSNFIIRLLSGVGKFKNYNTNFRIIRAETWKGFKTIEDRHFFLFETIFRAQRRGAKITEIPVSFLPRKFGESKVSFFKQAPKYFLKLLRYTFLGK